MQIKNLKFPDAMGLAVTLEFDGNSLVTGNTGFQIWLVYRPGSHTYCIYLNARQGFILKFGA
jgi:hypothetical protein